jgi:hypothetical protein
MSHYVKMSIQAQQRYEAELVAALKKHFGENHVESHGEKKADLLSWNGSKSGLKANIIIRRKAQEAKAGHALAVNDLGYERNKDGGYDVHLDADGFPTAHQNLIAQDYATRVATKQLKAKGYSVKQAELTTGEIRLVAQRMG